MRKKTCGDWRTSPTGNRIRAWFEAGGVGSAKQVGEACHTNQENARKLMNQMHEARAIHVCRWEYPWTSDGLPSGAPRRVYAWGNRFDAKRPEKRTKASYCRSYRRRVKGMFGAETGRAIFLAMKLKRSVAVVGGITVYRRGEGINREAASRFAE